MQCRAVLGPVRLEPHPQVRPHAAHVPGHVAHRRHGRPARLRGLVRQQQLVVRRQLVVRQHDRQRRVPHGRRQRPLGPGCRRRRRSGRQRPRSPRLSARTPSCIPARLPYTPRSLSRLCRSPLSPHPSFACRPDSAQQHLTDAALALPPSSPSARRRPAHLSHRFSCSPRFSPLPIHEFSIGRSARRRPLPRSGPARALPPRPLRASASLLARRASRPGSIESGACKSGADNRGRKQKITGRLGGGRANVGHRR